MDKLSNPFPLEESVIIAIDCIQIEFPGGIPKRYIDWKIGYIFKAVVRVNHELSVRVI